MAHNLTTEGATESVESVLFSFMTGEEVRNMSFKKITTPVIYDQLNRPAPGGLYDPELGPIDEGVPCKNCGQRSFLCPGHCGHIDLVSPVYNPLLFKTLQGILDKTCFFCHHFRTPIKKVKLYTTLLECIIKGDIEGAGHLYSQLSDKFSNMLETLFGDDDISTSDTKLSDSVSKNLENNTWTSLQHSMIKDVLHQFMYGKTKECKNCGAKNPTIRSPTFGWLQMDMSSSATSGNIIRGRKLNLVNRVGQTPVPEIVANGEDANIRGSSAELPEQELSGLTADGILGVSKNADKDKNVLVPTEFLKQKKFFSGHLLPTEVKDIIGRLWENEGKFCQLIFNFQRETLYMHGESKSHMMFFVDALLVPPNKFRPSSRATGSMVEHPQTVLLSKVLQCNIFLANAYMNESERSRIVPRWMDLQQAVNVLFDSGKALGRTENGTTGICQLLDKKEGVFRQKMMGKRVNFACRSVISPDPYLAVNEIGIPPYFALRLTYPERVTPWNVEKLRHAIINGSEVHPGATHYVDKLATRKLPALEKHRRAISRKLLSSRGVIINSGNTPETEFEGKTVCRHLQDGDVVLVNRQPTLHKPSMMAHVVRVLKGEKTLRMHYANCSTYNADFDGDEMNVHFPQDEISRAEAFNIANANEQYTLPTSGDPIRGLIQDHIVSAVLLTKRDTFLTRDEYHQLLYASCVSTAARDKFSKKVCMISSDDEVQPLPPAIWKPRPLWTGKQVITTILNYITRGHPPFTVKKVGRIPADYFGSDSGEMKLRIDRNEFIHGVIDKAQFGKYGLVHAVHELYGSNAAGLLLSVFSRLFTVFLQMYGFTCGVDDLLIVHKSDLERTKILRKSEKIGEQVHSRFIGTKPSDLDPLKMQTEVEKVIRSKGESATATLDRMMSSALNRLTSEVNNKLFPNGLAKPFLKNCLSLMTTTGAKGSSVNSTQISSMLGQQELEGKRVPRMVSGKTLPCFPPWDSASRAGGFISDRFLTGLRPQEYFFHCMAGRDGLVDTAIKTSRSGYLQRCLVKSLESLKVCYDYTVRDADGSIIQFCYGEDGVDVQRTSYLSEFKMLAANQEIVREKLCGQSESSHLFKSNSYIKGLPLAMESKMKDFIDGLTKKKRDSLHLRKKRNFLNLMKLKYLSCLAQPGEAVGVIAAQSVGEPSTQMTLNTFHFAGRGEMNVTLGIPRLQEILMRASETIQTPVMTCPLHMGRTRDDAERLAAELEKVTIANIVESMEVYNVAYVVHKQRVSTIYKLKVKLYSPELYPPYSNITLEDCHRTLKVMFVRELEDSIQNHLATLHKISGITDVSQNADRGSTQTMDEDDEPKSKSEQENNEDSDDQDEDANEDGVDAQKRRRQADDEMDYDDGIENEVAAVDHERSEEDLSKGFEGELDLVNPDDEDYTLGGQTKAVDDGDQIFDTEDGAPETLPEADSIPKSKLGRKEQTTKRVRYKFRTVRGKRENDRAIFVDAQGLNFEVHFRLIDEPHILLSQIANRAADKVYVKSSGNINRCSVVEYDEDSSIPALQTAGVNFQAFWAMQEDLNINKIKSNDIHAMLRTYGVEAARATIIKEVTDVFRLYGISVNTRHLTLIADYMTASGGYQPMSRFGLDKASISPFSKITFETATKFIVEAALQGEVERLESPSARISLGLPVKMGTGCFDLMQNLRV